MSRKASKNPRRKRGQKGVVQYEVEDHTTGYIVALRDTLYAAEQAKLQLVDTKGHFGEIKRVLL